MFLDIAIVLQTAITETVTVKIREIIPIIFDAGSLDFR